MAISPYFNHAKNQSEQDLFESMVVETIQLSGLDVYYIPAERLEVDPVLSEPVRTLFNKVVKIEAFMPNGGDVGADNEIMSKFGYVQRDAMSIVMAKRRFHEETLKELGSEWHRPREGDLIFIGDLDKPYASQVNVLFQINYVSFYEAVWTFGKTFAWKIDIAAYQFSHEEFDTETPLDDIMGEVTANALDNAVNEAVRTTKSTLAAFDKDNPLGNV